MADDKDKNTPARTSPQPKAPSRDRDAGSALRSAYQKTVDEQIPDDLLDLLNKLS